MINLRCNHCNRCINDSGGMFAPQRWARRRRVDPLRPHADGVGHDPDALGVAHPHVRLSDPPLRRQSHPPLRGGWRGADSLARAGVHDPRAIERLGPCQLQHAPEVRQGYL